MFALTHEASVRSATFACIFTVLALAEIAAPRRALSIPKAARWANNPLVMALNTLLLRLLFPFSATALALRISDLGWDVLNQVTLPSSIELGLGVVALDLIIYAQHREFHSVPLLWRLHRVHHADLDFDVTTGVRFHPLEMIVSMLIKWISDFCRRSIDIRDINF